MLRFIILVSTLYFNLFGITNLNTNLVFNGEKINGSDKRFTLSTAGHSYIFFGAESLQYLDYNGSNWSHHTLDDTSSADISVTAESNGAIHLLYRTFTNDVYATNKNGSWEFHTADLVVNPAYKAEIAIDTGGVIHIIYNSTNSELYHSWSVDGETWSSELLAEFASEASITIDSANIMHVAYLDAINTELHYDFKNLSLATEWTQSVLIPAFGGIIFSAITIDSYVDELSNGAVVIAYNEGVGGVYDSKSATKLVTNGSYGAWSLEAIESNIGGSALGINAESALSLEVSSTHKHIAYISANDEIKIASSVHGNENFAKVIDGVYHSNKQISLIGFENDLHVVTLTPSSIYFQDSMIHQTPQIGAYEKVAITQDTTGKSHIAFNTQDQIIRYSTQTNGSWEIQHTFEGAKLNSSPSIALKSDNTPSILYITDNSLVLSSIVTFNSSQFWFNDLGLASEVAIINDVAQAKLLYDDNDIPHICYINQGSLYYKTKDESGWLAAEHIVAGGAAYCDIALDSNGAAHIVFSTNIYKIFHTSSESGWWPIELQVSDELKTLPTIKVAPDNHAHVAFYNITQKQITYITSTTHSDELPRIWPGFGFEVETIVNTPYSLDLEITQNGELSIIYKKRPRNCTGS